MPNTPLHKEELIDRLFAGELSPTEEIELKKRIARDPELQEELRFHQELDRMARQRRRETPLWKTLEDLANAQPTPAEKPTILILYRKLWLPIAAAILLAVAILIGLYFYNPTPDPLPIAELAFAPKLSQTMGSKDPNQFNKALEACADQFSNEQYTQTIQCLTLLEQQNVQPLDVQAFLSAAYLFDGEYAEAATRYENLLRQLPSREQRKRNEYTFNYYLALREVDPERAAAVRAQLEAALPQGNSVRQRLEQLPQ